MVTARFIVSRVTPLGDATNPYAYEIEATPDYAQGRNSDWSAATPSGVCRLTITNLNAVEQLPQGTHLELTFKAIEDPGPNS